MMLQIMGLVLVRSPIREIASRLIVFLILSISSPSIAQLETQSDSAKWSSGKIQLISGKRLTGQLRYQPLTEVLEFKSGKKVSTLSAKNVAFFNIERPDGTSENHYSIPFDIHYLGKGKPVFFKVQYENRSIAILSRQELIYNKSLTAHEVALRGVVFGKRKYSPSKVNAVQEIIYLADRNGELVSFLVSSDTDSYMLFKPKYVTKKSGGYDFSDNFDGLVGFNGLKKIIGKHYPEMKVFVKEYNLDLTDLKDLKTYIDQYDSLLTD